MAILHGKVKCKVQLPRYPSSFDGVSYFLSFVFEKNGFNFCMLFVKVSSLVFGIDKVIFLVFLIFLIGICPTPVLCG